MHKESTRSSRYVMLCIVFALHLAVVAIFIFSSGTRLAHPTPRSTELLYLPRQVAQQKPPPPTSTAKAARREIAPTPPSQALMAVPMPEVGTIAPHIDWAKQAQAVAAESANSGSAPVTNTPPPNSPFAPHPAHHAGEEFVTATGDRAVFINEQCYQVSKTFAEPPNAISNGMGTQTYCIGPSNQARGDLFEKLPAYKKFNPDP